MKALFYDGLYTLGGRIVRSVLALALGVVTARLLGPYERGLYALPTAVYTGLVVSVFTGISLAISYFMLNAQSGREILRPAIVTSVLFCVAGAIPIAVAAQLAGNQWTILWSVLLLPPSACGMVLLGYAVGSKQIRWQTTYSLALTAALFAGVGAALALFPHTARVAVAAFVAVNAVIGGASLYVVVRDMRRLRGNHVPLRRFLLYAMRTGIVNLVTQLNYRADLYVVAILSSAVVLGQYAVAVAAAEGMLVVTQVAAIVTSPHVGALGRHEAALLTARCVRATLLISAALCAILFMLAPLLVRLLYGAAYLPLVPSLRVLLVAVLILSMGSPISNYFTLNRGKPEVALLSALCASIACVTISWILVARIGMLGAACATALAYSLGEGMRIAFFMRATGLRLRSILLPTGEDVRSYVSAARIAARGL